MAEKTHLYSLEEEVSAAVQGINWLPPVQTCQDLPKDVPDNSVVLTEQCGKAFVRIRGEWVLFMAGLTNFPNAGHDPNCPALHLVGQLAWR